MSEFAESTAAPAEKKAMPIVVLVIGMAGAGKTTVMHRLNLHMEENEKRGYYINLDPAVRDVPFAANIDIRDTVNYKEVMKQYGLGPNGGILTSLNLFATRFDQVVNILEKRSDELDYIFIDTPGQIESFTWSAGGQIIHELLATAFPTVIMYVTDTPRCSSPTTFMSNMLYASSVLYKSQLPMVCVFNKIDVCPCDFAIEWMRDFEAYQAALDADAHSGGGNGDSGEGYMSSLNRSLSLAMDEFYRYHILAGDLLLVSTVFSNIFNLSFRGLFNTAISRLLVCLRPLAKEWRGCLSALTSRLWSFKKNICQSCSSKIRLKCDIVVLLMSPFRDNCCVVVGFC